MMPHPATRLLMWLFFALFLPWLHLTAMAAVTLLQLPLLLTHGRSSFIRQLRRTRWLLLSIFLIYALATPGENLLEALGAFGPTREGVEAGAMQAWRLGLLLAGLALLLAATPGKQLLSGMYTLLSPWRSLGVASDRIAARIWLTLYYAEQAIHLKPASWRDKLQQALFADNDHDHPVSFEVVPLARSDWLMLVLTLAVLGGLAQ